MAHTITFENFDRFILSEAEVRDFIEMFYRWGDTKFLIRTDESERTFRGECQSNWDGHVITLVRKNIEWDHARGRACGGNLVAPTVKSAAGMVLAHEIEHANQSKFHKNASKFYGKLGGLNKKGQPRMQRYKYRACERDARQFADERLSEICSYFGTPFQTRQVLSDGGNSPDEVLNVAALLQGVSAPTMEDVRDELRASKILNPKNVQLVVEELKKRGVAVSP